MSNEIIPIIKPLAPQANHICYDCTTTENLTKHHINGNGSGPSVWLCRQCHDKRHNMIPKTSLPIEEYERRKAERLNRRAQRRIERDVKLVVSVNSVNRPWVHIADQWTIEEKREMYRYLEDFLLKERNKKFPVIENCEKVKVKP